MPTWTITSEQVEKFSDKELREYLNKNKKREKPMIIKNCIVEKFTPKGPNKDGECITTITIKAVNMSNEQIAELAEILGAEVDMEFGRATEDRNGQYKMNI